MWTWYIFNAFSAIDYRALGFADVAQVARGGRGDPQVVGVGRRFAPVGRRAQHAPLAALAGDDHLARTVLPAKKKNETKSSSTVATKTRSTATPKILYFFLSKWNGTDLTTQRRTVLPTKKKQTNEKTTKKFHGRDKD